MTLAATTVSSVALVSQSAILGYLQSVLAYIPACLRRSRGHHEKTTPSWDNRIADGNISIGPILYATLNCQWQSVLHIRQFRRAIVRPIHTDERAAD